MNTNFKHDLHFNQAVTRWDEALPLGNGLMGCLVWGNGSPLRFSLDRGDLWDGRVAPEALAADFNYKALIDLVKNQDFQAIHKRFEGFYSVHAAPTKIPAGRLELDFGATAQRIESHLSLRNAMAEVKLTFGKDHVVVKTFTHAVEPLGYLSIRGTAPLPGVCAVAHNFSSVADATPQANASVDSHAFCNHALLGYPPVVRGQEGAVSWFCQKTCEDLEFAVVLAQKKVGRNGLELAYTVAASHDGKNWLKDAKKRVRQAVRLGVAKVGIQHQKWWSDYWAKSSIRVPDPEMEKQWYLNNYLFGSCSRKGAPPMPLQGVWTEDDGRLPPWKGDYHSDLNVQMSYWHYLKANHLSEGESLLDFLWNLVPISRTFARDFFDAPGICLPSVMSLHGKPLGGWVQYSTNLVNQTWLCHAFVQHWHFTADQEFLKNRAYPYLKETAACILRWLKPGDDGKLRLPLSSSPEVDGNNASAWLTPNSNNDLSLLINLFKSLRDMAAVLKNGEHECWSKILQALPELAVNESKVLMLSPDRSLKETHRHLAHAMAIYPLDLLDYHASKRDKEIIDATIFDLECLGTGGWVGFSFPWMALLYARQGNGEGAFYQLKLFLESFCSQNGFNLNGDFKKHGVSAAHYRPFTLEGNMAAADALQEMLLQTHHSLIRVFPAVPESWRRQEISFQNFRGEGGVLISAKMKNNQLVSVCLKAESGGTFRMCNTFNAGRIAVNQAGVRKIVSCNPGEDFDVDLKKGRACIITRQGGVS